MSKRKIAFDPTKNQNPQMSSVYFDVEEIPASLGTHASETPLLTRADVTPHVQIHSRPHSLQLGVLLDPPQTAENSNGKRWWYQDYTTIDWMHDIVKDKQRLRILKTSSGIIGQIHRKIDAIQGWIVLTIVGKYLI